MNQIFLESGSESPHPVRLTETAHTALALLLTEEDPGIALRVQATRCSCDQVQYQVFLTNQYAKALARELAARSGDTAAHAEDDGEAAQRAALRLCEETVTWFGTFAVLVDPASAPLLRNATIDAVGTEAGCYFTIDNHPDRSDACTCAERGR